MTTGHHHDHCRSSLGRRIALAVAAGLLLLPTLCAAALPPGEHWECSPLPSAAAPRPMLWLTVSPQDSDKAGTIRTSSDRQPTYFRREHNTRTWYWKPNEQHSYALLVEPNGHALYYDFSRPHFFAPRDSAQPQYHCRKMTP